MKQRTWHRVLKNCGRWVILLALIVSLLIRFALMLYHRAAASEVPLLIDVLDVGQSDAVLLRSGNESLLVDTGTATAERKLLGELYRLGVKRLNTMCITHPHEDHYGNARAVLSTLPVGNLLLPEIPTEDEGYRLLLTEASKGEIPTVTATAGMVLRLGNCLITVLAAGGTEANNGSIILKITCGDTSLLLMGDAESEAEATLLKSPSPSVLDCDFLKVGHHGSDSGTTVEFLRAATPRIAAISCGKDNEYGFPHSAVLERLQEVGAAIYRTDENGTLRFASNGKTVYVREEN